MNFWAVGSSFGGTDDKTKEFIKNSNWFDGKYANGDEVNKSLLESIKVGDVLIMKSSSTKGKGHSITFTKVKAYGIVKEKKNINDFTIEWKQNQNFPLDFDGVSYRKLIEPLREDEIYFFIKKEVDKIKKNNTIDLLKYKKQIILQGPPGTGKTRLAKEIAVQIIENKSNYHYANFKPESIKEHFIIGQKIPNSSGKIDYYTIIQINDKELVIQSNISQPWKANYERTFVKYEELLNGIKPKNTNALDPYELAVAKYLHENIKQSSEETLDFTNTSEKQLQINIVQFHPSYSYEDFVRGIETTSEEKGIVYKNVNKTIAKLAKDALRNYKLSSSNNEKTNVEEWIESSFNKFKSEIDAKLPETETGLTNKVSIFEVNNNHYRYGKEWTTPGYLKFEEFKNLIRAVVSGDLKLSNREVDKEKFVHAHYRYTYYHALLKQFFKEYEYKKEIVKTELKNYVLIIDEINRANLSSVLGELIYALEYRGEPVYSMYEVDNSNDLILPPNLYIIGTMNTADRSVGHIDYAIRRRFAFVDVPPKDLSDDPSINFDSQLFQDVQKLFTIDNYNTQSDFISDEFEPKDVALGHSYFIDKTDEGGSMDIRLEYEIKPILREYVKDGILKEKASHEIEKLKSNLHASS